MHTKSRKRLKDKRVAFFNASTSFARVRGVFGENTKISIIFYLHGITSHPSSGAGAGWGLTWPKALIVMTTEAFPIHRFPIFLNILFRNGSTFFKVEE